MERNKELVYVVGSYSSCQDTFNWNDLKFSIQNYFALQEASPYCNVKWLFVKSKYGPSILKFQIFMKKYFLYIELILK